MKSLTFRIISDIVILFLIFLLPWWLAGVGMLLGLFFFDAYFEIILFGFVFDTLYSPSDGLSKYMFTIFGFILLAGEIFFKERMRI